MEPSLKDAKWGWNGKLNEPEEIYRNKLVLSTILLEKSAFGKINFKFHGKSEDGKDTIELKFNHVNFVQVEGPSAQALFKMAVFNKIEAEPDLAVKKELSLKH